MITDSYPISALYGLLGLVAQILLAIFAWCEIIVSKRKVSSTNKVKFKIRRNFVIAQKNNKNKVNFKVDIVNLGLAPVYIEEWGVAIHKPFRKCILRVLSADEVKLEPGKPYTRSFSYSHTEIKDRIGNYNYKRVKMSVYIKYHLGETYYSKKEKFSTYNLAYYDVKESVTDSDNEIRDMRTEIKYTGD